MLRVGEIAELSSDSMVVRMMHVACSDCAGLCPRRHMSSCVTVPRSPGARVGDRVTIEVDQGRLLREWMLACGLFLLALVVAAVIGHASFGDAGVVAGAIGGMFAALWQLRRRSLRMVSAWRVLS